MKLTFHWTMISADVQLLTYQIYKIKRRVKNPM